MAIVGTLASALESHGTVSLRLDDAEVRAPPGKSPIYADAFLTEHADSSEARLFWLASQTIANWNLAYGTSQPVYATGKVSRTLESYRDVDSILALIKNYGRPNLETGISTLHDMLLREPARQILVEGLPFMPRSSGDRPVGGWGYFPLRIFAVGSDGGKILIYSQRPS